MLKTRLTSSMEKCFPDDPVERFPAYHSDVALKGMQISLQLLCRETDGESRHIQWLAPVFSGELAPYAEVRSVEYIPSAMPAYPGRLDGNYLRTKPGLYPDLLRPLHHDGHAAIFAGQTRALWIDINLPEDYPESGEKSLTVTLTSGETTLSETFTLTVLDAVLPKQDFPVTEWFHVDCLASYYHVPVFSEEHWRIIENFMHSAVKNGINMILTPIFTPPLDTHVGGERPTVQLVDVTLQNGTYSFGYEKLDRWIRLSDKVGFTRFEISHLFTQWGAAHAPKIVGTADGAEKKLFGWETDATGEDYVAFLEAFLPDFLAHMKARGDDTRCIFHISDEPNPDHLDNYRKAKAVVSKYLAGYTTMDALSNYQFFTDGLVETPVVATNHIKPFLEGEVPNLWAYYCCGQCVGTSNRFFAMPGWRTRYMGVQMYYHRIKGFLQWGFNFYYNQGSYDLINPFYESTGEGFFPSGDGYSVYPSQDGEAWDSMRIIQFREGLDDMRIMRFCESLCGRETVEAILETCFGKVVFDVCPTEARPLLRMREALLLKIAEKM